MSEDKTVEARKEKIKIWLKDRDNLILLAVLAFAIIIRLYFFFITQNQAVWWDEGEYMLRVKHIVLDTPQDGFFSGRELFTPYFWALIYLLFKSEVAIRFVQLVISVLTVYATYMLGKYVYDKKIGILSALFMSAFWLHLFFTTRLLTYLYAPLFYTLALAFFWKGYISENEPHKDRYLFLSFLTIIIGLGIYTSIAFSAFAIIIYLFATERFAFLKNKRLWISAAKAAPFLLLSFIPSYIVQGTFIPRLRQIGEIKATETGAGLKGIMTYITMMPRLALFIYLIIMILSLFLVIRFLFFSDVIYKNKSYGYVKNDFYIFLGGLVIFGFYTWVSITAGGPAGANYDAWILPVFPFAFVLMSRFVYYIKENFISKISGERERKAAFALIIIIILFGAYQHISFANDSIKGKVDSFYNLKPAGIWIKENSVKGDTFVTSAVPEMTYYAERGVVGFSNGTYNMSVEWFLEQVRAKKPKYYVLTVWERSPEWAYSLPESGKLNMTPVQAYYVDPQRQQSDVAIYRITYN